MRILFILGTIVVLICSIYVSFNHTLELFMEGGYEGKLQWGITIAAEVSFLMGVLSRFKARLKGTKPHGPANFMFWVGIAVVGWSNWNAGAEYGAQGIIKGLLVPVFVFGSEAVLAREYMEWWKEKNSVEKSSADTIQPETSRSITLQKIMSGFKNIRISRNNIQSEMSGYDAIQPDGLIENIQPDKSSQDISKPDKASNKHTSSNTIHHEMFNVPDIQLNKYSENILKEKTSRNEGIQPDKSYENIQLDKSSENVQPDKNDENIQPDSKTKKSNVVDFTEHSKKRTSRRKKDTAAEIARVRELALKIKAETGDLPGRDKLKEKAGCSEYVAKVVLKELRQSS